MAQDMPIRPLATKKSMGSIMSMSRSQSPMPRNRSPTKLNILSNKTSPKTPPSAGSHFEKKRMISSPMPSPQPGGSPTSLVGLENAVAPRSYSPSSIGPCAGLSQLRHSRSSSHSPASTRSPISPATSHGIRSRGNSSPRRMKEVALGLSWDPMTTVQESTMDSPTIPGCGTYQEALGSDSLWICGKEEEVPAVAVELEGTMVMEENLRSPSRASSILLPSALAPLVIPSEDQYILSPTRYQSSHFDDDGPPPKVPPKSPRFLNRAFPQCTVTPINTVNNKINTFNSINTTAPINTVNSNINTFNAINTIKTIAPLNTVNSNINPFNAINAIKTIAPLNTANNNINPFNAINAIKTTSPATSTNTSNSSTASHTANSSITSVGSGDEAQFPRSWALRRTSTTPRSQSREPFISQSERTSPLPWSMKEFNANPVKKTRGHPSIDEEISLHRSATSAPSHSHSQSLSHSQSGGLDYSQSQYGHERRDSEDTIMNRGRPMRRGDITSMQRELTRPGKASISANDGEGLPAGYRKSTALTALSSDELRNLRKDAEFQAAKFETLHHADVSELYKELSTLPSRISHLRSTALSLREGRRALHSRITAYLDAPNAVINREHMMKQERALSALDASIDEWTNTLNVAEARRALLQQKLLEHAVSVLTLNVPVTPLRTRAEEEQTPPTSPERMPVELAGDSLALVNQVDGSRREVESIRVYADSGVASLLASIEMEIDMLHNQRHAQNVI